MATTQPQVNRIKVANPPLEDEVRTYLTADVAAAATTISTIDNQGFIQSGADDYYIIVGEYGAEKTEVLLVDADDAATDHNSFKVSAAVYTHETSDPVTFFRYNQVRIYGATASGGAKILLDTIDIDASQQYTEYVYEGAKYNYFYTAYYNSNDDEISAHSDEISNTSFSRRSIKRIIQSGLRKALTKIDQGADPKISWDIGIEIVQDGTDEILTRKRKWSFLRKIRASDTTTADQQYIDKPDDVGILEYLIVDGVALDPMTRIEYNTYTANGAVVPTGKPTHFVDKGNKWYVFPTPNGIYDVIEEYYKIPATITSDLSTEIDFPFVPILIHYCAAHFSWIRGNDKRGDKMYQLFSSLLEQQAAEYSGPDQTGSAESIDKTSPYGDDVEIIHGNFLG